MANGNGVLTPTEKRMLEVLSDGYLHSVQELHKCLWDEQGPITTVQVHLTTLRAKMLPKMQGVSCHKMDGTTWYQLVRLMKNPNRE